MHEAKRLQVLTSVQEYLEIVHDMEQKKIHSLENPAYWKIVPEYLVARCPICGSAYVEQIDTYSLRKWVTPSYGEQVFFDKQKTKRCEHFLFVHPFINLNGHIPTISETELRSSRRFISEVPHIIPIIFREEDGCHAVMHSLPVCRIEGGEFVPRYTVYTISYFALQEEHKRLISIINEFNDPKYHYNGYLVKPFADKVPKQEVDMWWDLPYWVERKKIWWVDCEKPGFRLENNPSLFPYEKIAGRKEPYFSILPVDERSKNRIDKK